MKIQKNLDLRTQRQQLEDEIQCLKNELYRWNDQVIEAKLALQEGDEMNRKLMFSNVNNAWCTPQDFFDKLNQEFDFNLDPCATEKSAKCQKFFTPLDDGLKQDWGGHRVFVNPPYGRKISKWVKKCYNESQKPNTVIVLLMPSRTDTRYFHDYILGKAEIRFIKGRLTFWDLDGDKYLRGDFKNMTPAPFPSMIVIFKQKTLTPNLNQGREE